MLAENDFKRSSVLRKLFESMKQSGVPGRILEKGEEDSPFEMLVCSHEGIPEHILTGQYFFPEMGAAENVCYFTAIVTIQEEIPKEKEDKIRKRAEETNPGLLCGGLYVYPEAGLVFKLTVPISEDLSENDLFNTIDITAAHALAGAFGFASEYFFGSGE